MTMNKTSLIELTIFLFFLTQLVSVIYLHVYWGYLGINPFIYINIQSVVFSASEYFMSFAGLTIFFIIMVYLLPERDYSAGRRKKGLILGFSLLAFQLIALYVATAYFPQNSLYTTSAIALSASVMRYTVGYIYSSLKKYKIINNELLLYICILISCYGITFSPSFALNDVRNDLEHRFKTKNSYVKLKDCDGCYYRLAGVLSDYIVGYDWKENKISIFPKDNVDHIGIYSIND